MATVGFGKFTGDTQRVAFGPAGVAEAQPPGQAPKGSRLEFRIVPLAGNADLSPMPGGPKDRLSMDQLLKELAEQGPDLGHRRGDVYQWFELGEGVQIAQAVIGEHGARRYVLLEAREPRVMLKKKGVEAWGVQSARPGLDDANRPGVEFELDTRGEGLFLTLTKANIGKPLAILVDDKVVSVPIIRTAVGRRGFISGRFTQEEAAKLARAVEVGMHPGAEAAALPPPATRPTAETATTAELSATAKLLAADPDKHTYTWRVDRKTSARLIYGVLEDVGGENPRCIVAAYEGKAESSVKDYTLILASQGDEVKVEIQDAYVPPEAGGKGAVWNTLPWPKGTEFTDSWQATPLELTNTRYLTLWVGTFSRKGKEAKRLALIAPWPRRRTWW